MSDNHSTHHVVPAKFFAIILGVLLVLTVLTVAFHNMHLGALAAPVAFLIATTKALIVMSYFMHMKWDSMINRVVFGTGFFFVALLFIITMIDVFTRVSIQSTL